MIFEKNLKIDSLIITLNFYGKELHKKNVSPMMYRIIEKKIDKIEKEITKIENN